MTASGESKPERKAATTERQDDTTALAVWVELVRAVPRRLGEPAMNGAAGGDG